MIGTILVLLAASAAREGGRHAPAPPPPVATFSIVARDPATGELGVAVQSRFLAVGAVVPWARAGVGAIATQAFANTRFGPDGLALLEKGTGAEEALAALVRGDEGRDRRQVGIVDAKGGVATYTGSKCNPWAGGVRGKDFCCQGNILAGEAVVKGMARAFEETKGDLGVRLLAALESGQAAGGDTRGKQSAAILVVREGGGYAGLNDRYCDLRVDDHPEPIAELRRIHRLWAATFGGPARARFGDAARERGDEATAEREHAAARGMFLWAIEGAPEDPRLRNAFAWFCAERRLFLEEAIVHAEKARSLAPSDPDILDTVATVQFERGKVREAIEIEESALKLRPEDAFLKEQVEKFRRAEAPSSRPSSGR